VNPAGNSSREERINGAKLPITVCLLLAIALIWPTPGSVAEGRVKYLGAPGVLALTGLVLWLLSLARLGSADKNGRGLVFVLLVFGLALVKLWLVSAQPVWAIGPAGADDRLFLRLARSLLQGQWLGPYDQVTLVKRPFYSMWIALSSWLGIPLLLGQNLWYVAACLTLVAGLSPLVPRRSVLLAIYVVLLLNPMTFTLDVLRVNRTFYHAETLLVIACLVGLHTRREASLASLASWGSGLGLALAAFWLTREESVWLLPSLLLLFGGTVASLVFARPHRLAARLALCGLALVVWAGALFGVRTINYLNYGVFVTCETNDGKFVSAYAALSRVEHASWQRYIPFPKETRQRIYKVSPAFRELEPFLEGAVGQGWAAASKPHYGDLGGGEVVGGWFQWALRDAVAMAGYYRDGKSAKKYYERLAAEVNRACDSGQLAARPRRSIMMPPWHKEYGPLLVDACWRGVRQLITFRGFNPTPPPSWGPEPLLDLFRDLTHDRVAPITVPNGDWPSPRHRQRLEVLQAVGSVYQAVVPWAAVLGGTVFLFEWMLAIARRKLPYLLLLNTAILLGLLARLLLLAMIDITSFPGFSVMYLCPMYPLLLLLIALEFVGLGKMVGWAWNLVRTGHGRGF
jgi:hypothetical protein